MSDCTTRKATPEHGSRHNAPSKPCLIVAQSPDAAQQGTRVSLAPGELLLIGRDVQEGLRLADPCVSRVHLRIVTDPTTGEFRYADAESANGTFVDALPATSGVLRAGQVMRVGDTLLVCEAAGVTGNPEELARRAEDSDLPVFIGGETGTGKELLARAIHTSSRRRGAFVPVNCAALPRDLAASELFGHTRSAFSGAAGARPGLFRAAEGGTLFLDEVGCLPPELQPMLLRTLEERTVRPVGSDREVAVDARVVAAAQTDLEAAVDNHEFRADLLARLKYIVIAVPPLRNRCGDILRLARHYVPQLRLTTEAPVVLLVWD